MVGFVALGHHEPPHLGGRATGGVEAVNGERGGLGVMGHRQPRGGARGDAGRRADELAFQFHFAGESGVAAVPQVAAELHVEAVLGIATRIDLLVRVHPFPILGRADEHGLADRVGRQGPDRRAVALREIRIRQRRVEIEQRPPPQAHAVEVVVDQRPVGGLQPHHELVGGGSQARHGGPGVTQVAGGERRLIDKVGEPRRVPRRDHVQGRTLGDGGLGREGQEGRGERQDGEQFLGHNIRPWVGILGWLEGWR